MSELAVILGPSGELREAAPAAVAGPMRTAAEATAGGGGRRLTADGRAWLHRPLRELAGDHEVRHLHASMHSCAQGAAVPTNTTIRCMTIWSRAGLYQ